MRHRVESILLVASPYDCFILEQDGRLTDQVFGEYVSLNLTHHPRFNRVSSGQEALEALNLGHYDLAIITAHNRDMAPLDLASALKQGQSDLPVVMLTYDRAAASSYIEPGVASILDGVYLWSGDPRLFLTLVKLVEDRLNVARDTRKNGIRAIVLVEDNPAFYSAYLPIMWTEVLNQTRSLMSDVLNDAHGRHRARARPKILHARTFEEAEYLVEKYGEFLMGMVCDLRFPRYGRLQPDAGWALIEHVRRANANLPILVQSSEVVQAAEAERRGVAFAAKNSPNLLNALRSFMGFNLGFGPFIFRRQDGQEVARAHTMEEMISVLKTVPGESLQHHFSRNNFSTWLMARTMFSLAAKIRPWRLDQYSDIEEMRAKFVETLTEYEISEQRGLVTDYVRGSNPLHRDFTRMGTGSMGGKARSIAFAAAQLANHPIHEKYPGIDITVPRTVVICSDLFTAFCEKNDLRGKAFAAETDEEVVALFLNQSLDPEVAEDLSAILRDVRYPLAVRSSSFSEDSAYQPLAGLFETVLLQNNAQSMRTRANQLSQAIRYVYSSALFQAPKLFMQAENVNVEAEQMAVILQRLVGRPFGDRFYPDFAGVAQSRNFYPVGNLKAEDGLVTVALGLGASVADGSRALRFCPRRPDVLPNMSSPAYALRSSQTRFWALDLSEPDTWTPEDRPTRQFDLSVAEEDGTLAAVGATYSAADDRIYDTIHYDGVRLVNFAHVLKYGKFPLAAVLTDLLELFEAGLGTEVEIEFAGCFGDDENPPELAVLQIRPLVAHYTSAPVELEVAASLGPVVIQGPAIGHGIFQDLRDIIFVDPADFDTSKTRRMADVIGQYNAGLKREGRHFLMAVPGRIGTEDPWLGIPVNWNQVSQARVMVEMSTAVHWVDPSQGSHFFHNLTSLKVGYFSIEQGQTGQTLDLPWFRSLPVIQNEAGVFHARLEAPLEVRIDGHQGQGIVVAAILEETMPPTGILPPEFS